MRTLTRRVVRHLNRQGRLRGELAAALWEQRRLRRTVKVLEVLLSFWMQPALRPSEMRLTTMERQVDSLRRALGEMRQEYEDLRLAHDALAREKLQELGEL